MSFEVIGVRLVAEGADSFAGDMAKANKAIDGFGSTASGTFKQMPGLADVAVGALHRIGEVAVNALGAAAQATGQFLKDSISKAGDFQAGMLEFQAVAGKDVDTAGLQKFHDQFIQLGKDLPVSTADVQQAAIELVKGGIDPATVAAGGLKQSIQFAAAAMKGDLAGAAEVSAKIVGGWADVSATAADKAALLAHGTDLLTKAANASTVEVHDLALGLYNVQGTAKTTGLSLEETTTTLAEIAPRFANANTAGTSFRNFLVRINPTTKPAIGAMKDLGLYTDKTGSKFYDANGKFIGVAKASQLLQDATKNLSAEQRTQALQTIFGNDAMNAAAAFAELGAQGYDNMTASLNKANGVQANATLKQSGFNTALENAKGSVEALQITVGEHLLPILTTLLNNVIAPAINTVTTFTDAVFGNAEAFDKLPGPLQAIVGAIQGIQGAFSGLAQMFSGGAAVGLINLFYKIFPPDIAGVLTDNLIKLRDIFAGVFDVLGRGNEPLTTAVNLLYKLFPADVAGQVVDGLFKVRDAFGENGIVGVIQLAIDELAKVSPAFALIKGVVEAVFPKIQDIIASVFDIITNVMQSHGDTMLANIQSVWGKIWSIINAILPPIQKIVSAVFGFIADFLHENGDDIAKFLATTWDHIYQIISVALDLIKAIVVPVLTFIAGFIQAHGDTIKGILLNTWNAIKAIIDIALTLIKGILTAALQIIQGNWQGAWNTIKAMSARVVLDILDIFQAAVDNFKKTFTLITDTIRDVWKSLIGDAKGIGINIVEGIASGITSAVQSVIDAAVSAVHRAVEAAKNAAGIGSPSKLFAIQIGVPIAQGVAFGIDRAAPLIMNSLQSALIRPASSPMAMMAAGSTTNATYNQQRDVTLNYNTTYAPPASTSLAIANALGNY